jgi:hypothetical protein
VLEALSKLAFEAGVARLDCSAVKNWGWTVLAAEYPTFDVLFDHATALPLRLKLDCSQWDELPPSVELLKADGSPVTAAPGNGGIFHPGPHPITGKFFVCMRGIREYHTHSSHVTELWDDHKGKSGNDLMGIVTQIYRAWRKAVG